MKIKSEGGITTNRTYMWSFVTQNEFVAKKMIKNGFTMTLFKYKVPNLSDKIYDSDTKNNIKLSIFHVNVF